jgi:acyl carrier protein
MTTKNMTEQEILDAIKLIISNQSGFEISDITADKSFADLLLDSLDIIEIIMECEVQFQISIDDEEIYPIVYFDQFGKLILSKV